MEFYSKLNPNLVAPDVRKTVYKIIQTGTAKQTVSEKVSSMISEFYKNYIENHQGKIFLVVIIIVFLLYRYYNRSVPDDDGQEGYTDQTAHLRYNMQPSFDRLQPVDDQRQHVFYPPDPLPINIPGQGIAYRRNIYPPEPGYPNLIKPDVDYNNVYSTQGLNYHTGLYNPYAHSQDTNIQNPLGYPTNFNSSTGHFVGQMTDANKQNLVDYQTILDSMDGNLMDSLKIGPKYLDENVEMDPPYAH